MRLPRLYPIVDTATLDRNGWGVREFVQELLTAGAQVLQLRNKDGAPAEILQQAEQISRLLDHTQCALVMNDRADLALLAGWKAVHVGHRDLSPAAARVVLGPDALVGVSTHNLDQVVAADAGTADYVAIGPVFTTGSKLDTEPVVGLAGVRQARQTTKKPLVAIGGITVENAAAVVEAGADSVAVIGALFADDRSPADVVRDFLRRLR